MRGLLDKAFQEVGAAGYVERLAPGASSVLHFSEMESVELQSILVFATSAMDDLGQRVHLRS